jgi:hypothetical protein
VAVLPVISPRVVGTGGIDTGNIRAYSLIQGAAFREGDFVRLEQVGSTITPAATGTLANYVGPTVTAQVNFATTGSSAVTSGPVTVFPNGLSGAPAQTYYVVLSYCDSTDSNESNPGAEFLVNCSAGVGFGVVITSAGAPSGSGYFNMYVSTTSGSEQYVPYPANAEPYSAPLNGSTPSLISYPLINSQGLNRADDGTGTVVANNITGLVIHDSQSLWAYGVGGSYTAGGISQLLGAWMPPPNLGPIDPSQALVVSALNNQVFEINFAGTWNNSLIGSTSGLQLASNGYFVAQPYSDNSILTIVSKTTGAPSDVGGPGDVNARVNVIFNSGVI